jgi:hypothetical protein
MLDNFDRVFIQIPDVYRIEYRANDKIFYLVKEPTWFTRWIELEGIVDDDFGDVFWIKFSVYIDSLKKPLRFMEEARRASTTGERNEVCFAKELRAQNQHFLTNKSLGELCAVVRLARSKGLLVFRNEDRPREV